MSNADLIESMDGWNMSRAASSVVRASVLQFVVFVSVFACCPSINVAICCVCVCVLVRARAVFVFVF